MIQLVFVAPPPFFTAWHLSVYDFRGEVNVLKWKVVIWKQLSSKLYCDWSVYKLDIILKISNASSENQSDIEDSD